MPVHFAIEIQPLSSEEFSELDYGVMGHAYRCQNQIGRLADERVYEANLASRLNLSHRETEAQVPLVVSHASFSKTYFLDLVVFKRGVYELKTVAKLTKQHESQMLNYLYLLDLPRGKLINFRSTKVESTFVNAPLSRDARTSFEVDEERYVGDRQFVRMVVGLVRDLGTSLAVSLYREVVIHLLGGETVVSTMLPLGDGQTSFGNQRFDLVSRSESLRITCFKQIPADYESQLRSLLRLSTLDAAQWVNINLGKVTFRTIAKH